MNLIYAVLLWMIGLKLQMGNAYYVVIVLGVVIQILVSSSKNS